MRWNRPFGIDEKRIGWGGDDCLEKPGIGGGVERVS